MGRVLCMQMEKLKCFRTNGSEEVGDVRLNMLAVRGLRRKIDARSMTVIGRASIPPPAAPLFISCFFSQNTVARL